MLNVASNFFPIGHALGFYHEQSRPDRDQLVEIKFDNIIEGITKTCSKFQPRKKETRGNNDRAGVAVG